jgi:hypothetical protein
MTRRILETGISVYASCTIDGNLEAAGPGAAGKGLYDSTSCRVIRPSGPVPFTLARGMPCSNAIFFAIGDANVRPPKEGVELCCGVAGGVFSNIGEASSDLDGVFSALGGGSAALPDFAEGFWEALATSSSIPSSESPCSPTIAIADPTAIFFVPS